ncbi:hypothetical protein B0T22DRAFT_462528 [Podospora appendiculata]|uniref:Secreted protein n=1 Tax=Podospora appendiculata TaxID=314037 RepID=A0AAE0XC44_9PEZI|nr:hypothetical protein B0T22DRAFT_462528 [Podospora appendiculata]
MFRLRPIFLHALAAWASVADAADAATTSVVIVPAFTPLDLPPLPSGYHAPGLPVGPPLAAPTYMVNNDANVHRAAPDKGSMDGPVIDRAGLKSVLDHKHPVQTASPHHDKRQTANCNSWLCSIAHGSVRDPCLLLLYQSQFFTQMTKSQAKK